MEKESFGILWPYLIKEEITDIDYNGEHLWLTYENGKRKREPLVLSKEFVNGFTQRIANRQQKSFHPIEPVLEAETDKYRISILHEAIATNGRSISIRKSLPKLRYTEAEAMKSGLIDADILNLLSNCIKARMNFVFCGEPGVGKTECAKFFASKIPCEDRIVTIEDNPEWHLKQINPLSDIVEMKVHQEDSGKFSYKDGIKAALRMNPRWLMVSEARAGEAKQLISAWSTGVSGITTIHTDDVAKIPERILCMMEEYNDSPRLENEVYRYIDIGVLLVNHRDGDERYRRIEQVAFFYRENGKNICYRIWEDGHLVTTELPSEMRRRMSRHGITDPWKKEGEV